MRDAADTPAPAGCCAAGTAATLAAEAMPRDDGERWARPASDAHRAVDFLVPDIRCAACMSAIETGLGRMAGVDSARVNLSMRRVSVLYDPVETGVDAVRDRLGALGYEAQPFDADAMAAVERDTVGRDLLARMGVAGFAAMNVMLLSVAVWSGAEAATRDLLHWVSAMIALPAVAFAGVPFFASAWRALKSRRLNMDVPISLAICLATGNSLLETAQSGQHAYFDAAISLTFFLLIGRYLDHRTRAAARSAAAELSALQARSATVIGPDGRRHTVPADTLAPGTLIAVAAGERIPADGRVETGSSDLDRSLVTGESMPETVAPGGDVHAGMLNLSGPLTVRAKATGEETLLAEIARMIAAAERGRTRYDRWADQAAKIYAPGVHLVALAAFIGWMAATGDLRVSLNTAIALLIITCPCALGLAVPAVHAVAGGRLFRKGIFLKDAGALERLAGVDTVAFDKTGTLTDGRPVLSDAPDNADPAWPLAAALAQVSHHPLARAVARAAEDRGITPADEVADLSEIPGCGVEGTLPDGRPVRLGSATWTGATAGTRTGVWLRVGSGTAIAFHFRECVRSDASDVCRSLSESGRRVVLLSGDVRGPVAEVASAIGLSSFYSQMTPKDKLNFLTRLEKSHHSVLMVGDGLNDAPALAAADVSMSPVSGADASRTAADLVFTGSHLSPVQFAMDTAQIARNRAMQNFVLAAGYNAIAIPIALLGYVTPLVAALAMSLSSIVVMLNSLRSWSKE